MRRPLVTVTGTVLAIACIGAAPAAASTVEVDGQTLRYKAADGEANKLEVSASVNTYTFKDPGAKIEPGMGCTAANPKEATCTATGLNELQAFTEDGDDTITVTGAFPNLNYGVSIGGGTGNDKIQGGDGGDSIGGGGGNDEINGGGGNDYISDDDNSSGVGIGPDTIDGGAGTDEVAYGDHTAPVIVNLADSLPDGQAGENDTLTGVESADGGSGADTLTGNAGANQFQGGDGNDKIKGGGGNDLLRGQKGNDKLDGGAGNDNINGGPGTNSYSGGAGKDVIDAQNGKRETVRCGSGRDKARVDKADKVVGCEAVRRKR